VPPELVERYVAEGWWTDETLGQTVAAAVARLGDARFAIHSKVRPWQGTFAEVDAMARSFAASLQARGVGPGDVVVFQLPNWVEAAVTFWGAAQLGAVVVPIVHFYGPKEVAYVLDVVQPDVVITAAAFGQNDYLASYGGLLADGDHERTPWFVVGAEHSTLPARAEPFDVLLEAEPLPAPLAADPDGPAVIGFTSGTTRNPKGVIHSHRTLGFEVRQLEGSSRVVGPPNLTGAPVGHFIGMLSALLIPLLRDQPINLIDVWDPGEVLRIMQEEHLSMGGGATFFVTSVLDHPDFTEAHLALVPAVGMGGSVVPVAVTERLAGLGITAFRAYGSTEHPSITSSGHDAPEDKRLRTDGCPLPGVEVRLDEQGEISSRGPDLFLGYTDPALTAEVLDEAGWYRTGDVGVLDGDGYLTITDRVADIIIRGGENISAQEVEEQLLGLPGVAEAVVVGTPDDRLGERATAVLRTLPDAAAPTLDDVRTHLAAVGLAKQKWPESLHVVSDLPRTPSGKVKKFELRRQLREGGLEHAIAAAQP
jgi:acyl-CoA synthetase (AMP-forming)/AMP-acid ligase II